MSGHGAPTMAIEGADGLRAAVVASSWHTQVMDGLLAGAVTTLAEAGIVRFIGPDMRVDARGEPSTADEDPLPQVFTATSAVCVTGLVTVDTATPRTAGPPAPPMGRAQPLPATAQPFQLAAPPEPRANRGQPGGTGTGIGTGTPTPHTPPAGSLWPRPLPTRSAPAPVTPQPFPRRPAPAAPAAG